MERTLRKYDSNIMKDWEILIDGPQSDHGYSIAYDPVNNLIYLSGQSLGANMNPLGDEYIPITLTVKDTFLLLITPMVSFNLCTYLQMALRIISVSVGLEIMENRLLISGTITGYPDIDVTDDQFYPIQNYPFQNNTSSFVSIYI